MSECTVCKNEFMQPFVCTTCGAEKLYDATLASITEQRDQLEQRLKVSVSETVERCAKVCDAMNTAQYRGNKLVFQKDCAKRLAEQIRALSPKVDQEPVQTIGGNDPEYLAEVFWRNKDRRIRGERRVPSNKAEWDFTPTSKFTVTERSGTDRRKA